MTTEELSVKIGLESHIQLSSLRSKLFCSCSANYRSDPPNTHLCPVCLGMPGTLPTLNEKAVKEAIMVAIALRSKIQRRTLFYRKNYYYPDMSKNFQITQYDGAGGIPFSIGGYVGFQINNLWKRVKIRRIQIEEDPAKLIYSGSIITSQYSLVDYNRAGIALLEIVTEPDLESPKEARLFLQKLRSILEHLEVSDGRLEGAMRCDANVSLKGGRRVEIKNISSFKEVERALNFEIIRQKSLVSKGIEVMTETRHWDEGRRITITLRTKEAEHDYRYFPELDLVPIKVTEEQIQRIKAIMPELPDARKERFIKQYRLPLYDADVLTRDKALADLFEECVMIHHDAKNVANWVMGDLLRSLHREGLEIEDSKITPMNLAEMIRLIDEGVISGKIGKSILHDMVITGKSPAEIAKEKNLIRISSYKEIEQIVDNVFKENPKAVQDALADEKAMHYLVGQLMKLTRATADPEIANQVIKEKLEQIKRKISN